MADAEKLFENLDLQDEIKNTLLGRVTKIEESFNNQIADANRIKDETIQSRQKAKEKVAELEKKIASGDTEAAKLLETKQAELDALTAKVTGLETSLEDSKSKLTEFENSAKSIYKDKFSESEWSIVSEKLSLTELAEVAKSREIIGTSKKNPVLPKSGDDYISEEDYKKKFAEAKSRGDIKKMEELNRLSGKSMSYWKK